VTTTVRIHRREETEAVGDAGEIRAVLAVTYSTKLMPPATVFIPVAEATEERVAVAIREDLAARQTEPPATLEV